MKEEWFPTWRSAVEPAGKGMNPEDTRGSDTTFLVLSSWATLKDMNWGTAVTLLEKGHWIPAPLPNPRNCNKVSKISRLGTLHALACNKSEEKYAILSSISLDCYPWNSKIRKISKIMNYFLNQSGISTYISHKIIPQIVHTLSSNYKYSEI